jgi:hypothetical protein
MLSPIDSNLSQFSSIHVIEIYFHMIHFNVLSSTFVLGPQFSTVWKIFRAVILYVRLLRSIQTTSSCHRNLIYLTFQTKLEKM